MAAKALRMEGAERPHWRATWPPSWHAGDHFSSSSMYVVVMQHHLLHRWNAS